MTNYDVNYTDSTKTPIEVTSEEELTSGTDVHFFGRAFLEYGEQLNENLLHILENFACPELALDPGNPDTTESINELLSEPTPGQWWYNTTTGTMYYWDGSIWMPLGNRNDYAANWGQIADGGQLPRPVSASTGYIFPYSECIWSVAPANFAGHFDWMGCSTDSLANVTMKYRYPGYTEATSGIVNYLIIGIKGNQNNGVTPIPVPSPSPSAGAPPTPTPSPTPTVTITPSITPTISVTPSITPSTGASQTPTPTRTPTPTPTPSTSEEGEVEVSPTASPEGGEPTPTPSGEAATPTPSPIPPTPTPSSSTVYDPLSAVWVGGNSNAVAIREATVPNCEVNVGPGSTSDSVTLNVTGGSGSYTITVVDTADNCFGPGAGNSDTTTSYSIGASSVTLTADASWNGSCSGRNRFLTIDITIVDNETSAEIYSSGTAFSRVYIGISGESEC